MIMRPKAGFNPDMPDSETLYSCVSEHEAQKPRLTTLKEYFEGRHGILKRERVAGLPNNRLIHAYPRYICAMSAGYLIGSPVTYACASGRSWFPLMAGALRRCDSDAVDAELAKNAAIFGKGVEIIYANREGKPVSVAVSPIDAFVVYSDSVDMEPLFGMYILPKITNTGGIRGWRITVMTESRVIDYEMRTITSSGFLKPVRIFAHALGGVPMIEYWNNEAEKGDFEDALTLIDAYDALQSDRLNDKQQFVDALLVLYGCTLETDAQGRSPGRQLREDKAIALPDGDARAEWLCKQLNEQDTEVLKASINADIHKMCMVPDMTDLNFAGNVSGVAMRYKLMGLEQMTKVKERWFREGLRRRLERYAAQISAMTAMSVDASEVDIAFTRALPENHAEEANVLSSLREFVDEDVARAKAEKIMGE